MEKLVVLNVASNFGGLSRIKNSWDGEKFMIMISRRQFLKYSFIGTVGIYLINKGLIDKIIESIMKKDDFVNKKIQKMDITAASYIIYKNL